jgi:Tfp pilus assembly protein PilN
MALHINLYHEIEKQKALQRRDPLKLSLFGIAALAVGCAGYYVHQLNAQRVLSKELSALQADYSRLEPRMLEAVKRQEELTASTKVGEVLSKRVEDRFFWAPVLEVLTDVVPHDVQVTKLSGDVSGDGFRRCSMVIEGLAIGAEPRQTAEDLRKTVAQKFAAADYKKVSSDFKTLEDSRDPVVVGGRAVPAASFSINVQIQTGEEAAPEAAAPKRERRKRAEQE